MPSGFGVTASQIAQTRLASATASTIFTATLRTEVHRIHITNVSGTNDTFRLYHDEDGNTFDETTALYWDEPASAGRSFVVENQMNGGGITLKRGAALGFRPATNNALTITVYGETEHVAEVLHRGT